jgi:hypothetical protein
MQTKTFTNQQTGTPITVGLAEAPEDGGRYAAICDDHHTICQFDTARAMWDFARSPLDWCLGCQRAHSVERAAS